MVDIPKGAPKICRQKAFTHDARPKLLAAESDRTRAEPTGAPMWKMRKNAHRAKNGQGLLVMVRHTLKEGQRQTVRLLKPERLEKGRRMTGWCIHHVGGSTNASLTALRRQRIRLKHNKSIQIHCGGEPGRCQHHYGSSWKKKAVCGAR